MENQNFQSEHQIKSFHLSPHPDSHHSHRVLLYGLGALLITIITLSAGYLLGIKNMQLVSQSSTIGQSGISKQTLTNDQTAAYIPGVIYLEFNDDISASQAESILQSIGLKSNQSESSQCSNPNKIGCLPTAFVDIPIDQSTKVATALKIDPEIL